MTNSKSELQLSQDKIERLEVRDQSNMWIELIYGENIQDNFDKVVRIVILILIFVFDPLIVLLLIKLTNISLNQWRQKENH